MKLFSLFYKSIFLDIYDLNFSIGSETLGKKVSFLPKKGKARRSIIYHIGVFFIHLLKSLKHITRAFPLHRPRGKILFYACSKNQKDCLLPIEEKTSEALFVGGSVTSDLNVDIQFPLFFAHIISIFYFPVLLFHFYRARGFRKESFFYHLDEYWLTYGYFTVSWLWLDYLAPGLLCFANDHSMPARMVAFVAKNKKITTLYIQHAAVTDQFPPLIYDYALLEGMDSLQKYAKIGNSNARVYLIGKPKSDAYYPYISKNQHVNAVGISLGRRDQVDRVEKICKILRQAYPELEIWLRPHPGDKRQREWDRIAAAFGLKKSDSDTELSFDYLCKIDAMIAEYSNMLLEAVLLNVFPICCELSGAHTDWYGFAEQGLVEYFSDPHQVVRLVGELIIDKPSVRERAKFFCATIGTAYDGCSTTLALKIFKEVLIDGKVDPQGWNLIQGVSLQAYEPMTGLDDIMGSVQMSTGNAS